MKKIERLLEIKRQMLLARKKEDRIQTRIKNLTAERKKVLNSFTDDEMKLYKDRIERAYHDNHN